MNKYLLLVLFVIFIVFLIRYHLQKLNLYKCSYILPGPFAWPVIGNALWCLGNSEDIIKNVQILTEKYNSPFRFWLGSKLVVAVTKPKDLEVVLNSCVQKEESVMKFLRPFIGNGLITAQSTEWKLHRKIINPTFNPKILNSFIPTFVEHSNILIQKLNKCMGRNEFDIYKHISLNTLDIVCDTTMGIKVNAQVEHSEYAETLHRLLSTAFSRMTHIWSAIDTIFYCLPAGKQFVKDLKVVHDFADKVLQMKRTKFKEKNCNKTLNQDHHYIKRKAFLEHLLELENNENSFNESQVFDEINTFIAAGTDTISSIISFTCMLLGKYQNIQEKVYEEVTEVLGESTGISSDQVPNLQYLERVIKETMRLFPPTPLLIRSTVQPIQLESCLLPANTAVLYVILHTHRDPNIWPDPLKFDPDRFLPENVSQRHSFSYLPFGAGLRNCIGMRYAMIAMKIVLAMLIQNFKFNSSFEVNSLRLENSIVMRPVLGHLVKLEARYPSVNRKECN